ncbi:hypothetical protein HY379_00540 [Candidatus Saccharibacteria bacterium]|nr:hypothetical protein [Candidatus Saccharibacteria bacterium]
MEKKKIYVGCSLTLASEAFKENAEEVKDRLRSDWDVMEFLGLVAGTEVDVYQKDIVENVGGCDAFLGICDEPSIGLGWELREATALQKPTLAVAHVDSRVTRLVLGAPAFNPTMAFRRYENMVEDVPKIVAEEFEVVRNAVVIARSIGE